MNLTGIKNQIAMASLFRTLTPKEVLEFQQAARANYAPGDPISGVWHPVYQAECVKMNSEKL